MYYLRRPDPRLRELSDEQAAVWIEREDRIGLAEGLAAVLQFGLLLGGCWGLVLGFVAAFRM
jgi:hypothetical protein